MMFLPNAWRPTTFASLLKHSRARCIILVKVMHFHRVVLIDTIDLHFDGYQWRDFVWLLIRLAPISFVGRLLCFGIRIEWRTKRIWNISKLSFGSDCVWSHFCNGRSFHSTTLLEFLLQGRWLPIFGFRAFHLSLRTSRSKYFPLRVPIPSFDSNYFPGPNPLDGCSNPIFDFRRNCSHCYHAPLRLLVVHLLCCSILGCTNESNFVPSSAKGTTTRDQEGKSFNFLDSFHHSKTS